ncbi:N-acetylmuramic acid 6-phosphate etherase [Bacillus kwashiorkori]|uniref:N-acetylmuramic acid 6-phosphate etherase n=1 Tax=Bacillus kwashiorkori TaxID=1522318 RepID=UPI000780F8F5|nr:N-acetylmuramic acid 6-phosphate etherase [Bacillus kwashiorkori]
MEVNLSKLTTEKMNPQYENLDQMTTLELVKNMNQEDYSVPAAVNKVLPEIANAIEIAYNNLKNGGRLIYIGAGTSGRLGVLDAAECPPTFFTDPELVQGIMAGGERAMFRAIEGAEDDYEGGKVDLQQRNLQANDVVVGITASGRTPYVMGALDFAKCMGAKTISISCNKDSEISKLADQSIEVVVGPEILTGSTRLKAATAQKMVLNMISTGVMVKLGKVYKNLMVDLHPSNSKLMERAKRIVMEITGCSYDIATETLKITEQKVKLAIVMIMANVSHEKAQLLVKKANGNVRKAINIDLTE